MLVLLRVVILLEEARSGKMGFVENLAVYFRISEFFDQLLELTGAYSLEWLEYRFNCLLYDLGDRGGN